MIYTKDSLKIYFLSQASGRVFSDEAIYRKYSHEISLDLLVT